MLKLLTLIFLAGVSLSLSEERQYDDTTLGEKRDLPLEQAGDVLPDLKRTVRGFSKFGGKKNVKVRPRRTPVRIAPARAKAPDNKHISTTKGRYSNKQRKSANANSILKDKSDQEKAKGQTTNNKNNNNKNNNNKNNNNKNNNNKNNNNNNNKNNNNQNNSNRETTNAGTNDEDYENEGWFKKTFKAVLKAIKEDFTPTTIVNYMLQGLFHVCDCTKTGANVRCECCVKIPDEIGCITMETYNEGTMLDLKIHQLENGELTQKKPKDYSCTVNLEEHKLIGGDSARKGIYKSHFSGMTVTWAHLVLRETSLTEEDADGRACFKIRFESFRKFFSAEVNACIIENETSQTAYVQKMDDISVGGVFNVF